MRRRQAYAFDRRSIGTNRSSLLSQSKTAGVDRTTIHGIGTQVSAPQVKFTLDMQALAPVRQEVAELTEQVERLRGEVLRVASQARVVSLSSLGSDDARLRLPLSVEIHSGPELVTASSVDFETYGVGETEGEALDDLRHSLMDAYRFLRDNEGDLGPHPARMLARFRDVLHVV